MVSRSGELEASFLSFSLSFCTCFSLSQLCTGRFAVTDLAVIISASSCFWPVSARRVIPSWSPANQPSPRSSSQKPPSHLPYENTTSVNTDYASLNLTDFSF